MKAVSHQKPELGRGEEPHSYVKRMMIGSRWGTAAELPLRNNPLINNGVLISAGAAAASDTAGAATGYGPISYPLLRLRWKA